MGNVVSSSAATLTSCTTGGALSYPYTRPGDETTTTTKKKKTPPPQTTDFPDLLLPPHHRTFKRKPLTLSLKKLPALIVGTLSRRNNNNNNKQYYTLPPNAETPSSPSSPEVFQDQDEYFVLRWDPPAYDGGIPIIGYVIQHVELGLPPLLQRNSSEEGRLTTTTPQQQQQHQNQSDCDECELWYSSDPGEITSTECILNNLVPGTTYQFRVVAENLLGFSPPSDPSHPIVFNPHNDLDDWFTLPEFSACLDDVINVLEHETVTLSVEVRGQPYPLVRWYDAKDAEVVKSNPRFKVRAQGFTRSLTINSVALSDAGVFKCVASNSQGDTQCETNLVVEAPPRIKRIPHGDLLQSPYDLTEREMAELDESTSSSRGPSPYGNNYRQMQMQQHVDDPPEDEVILAAGELLRVKYAYAGEPKPDVTVFHNHADDDEQRASVEMSERVLTLKVEGVTREDRGEWVVRLENALGEDTTPPLLVTVTDHPSCPGRPELLQLPDNTCILKWAEPVDDGGCPIHNYLVEYFRFEWGVWLKALTTRVCHARVKDLIPGSKYKFRVKAENLYGTSAASVESVDILITDTPSSRINNESRTNDGLMRTLDENEEEEDDVDDETTAMSLEEFIHEEQAASPMMTSPQIVLPRSPVSRSSVIKSSSSDQPLAAAAGPPKSPNVQQQLSLPRLRLLAQLSGESRLSSMDDEDFSEVDFAKLEAEYEEEMRGVAELDDLEDEAEFQRIKMRWEEENRSVFNRAASQGRDDSEDVEYADLDWSHWRNNEGGGGDKGGDNNKEENGGGHEQQQPAGANEDPVAEEQQEQEQQPPEEEPSEEEEEEEPEYIPQYRVGASRFDSARNSSVPPTLPDRFTDYLTMKVASRDGKIASSMRSLTHNSSQTSLNKSSSREQSRENIRKLFIEEHVNSTGQEEDEEEIAATGATSSSRRQPMVTSSSQRWSRNFSGAAAAAPTKPPSEKEQQQSAPPPTATPPPASAASAEPAVVATPPYRSLTPLLILSCLLLPPTLYVDVYLSLLTLLLLLLWNKYVR